MAEFDMSSIGSLLAFAGAAVIIVTFLWAVPEFSLFVAALVAITYGIYVLARSPTIFVEIEGVIAVIGGGILIGLSSIIRLLRLMAPQKTLGKLDRADPHP